MLTPNFIGPIVAEMTALRQRMQAQIEAAGPIPFESFMAEALYDRQLGFFSQPTLRSTKGGDFLTSPEVSPLYGETLAHFVAQEHQRLGDPFRLVEAGAGSGSLLEALLAVEPVEAWAVDASPAARQVLALVVGEVVEDLSDVPGPFRGVILANELLDNLPMALAVRSGSGWRERWVGSERDSLVLVDAPPRDEIADWCDRFAGPVPEGGVVEVQIAAGQWLQSALELLSAGTVLVIDYGEMAENLESRRGEGTLRTYRAHHLGPHPLDEPGATDITADVNFTALLSVAAAAGARVELMRQDDFLTSLGLRERLSDLRRRELELARGSDHGERLAIRALRTDAETLLHPRGLGDFRVLVARK